MKGGHISDGESQPVSDGQPDASLRHRSAGRASSGSVLPTTLLKPIRDLAGLASFAPDALLTSMGVEPAQLEKLDARVPHSIALEVWSRAARRTSIDVVGLIAAQATPLEALQTLGYALRHSGTLGEFLERFARHGRMLHGNCTLRLEGAGDCVRIIHSPRYDIEPPAPAVEFVLAGLVLRGRHCTGVDFAARAVNFRHVGPQNPAVHRALFRAPVRFKQTHSELVLDRALLSYPLRAADQGLAMVLDDRLKDLLSRQPSDDGFVSQLKREIRERLEDGPPTIDTIARKLHLAQRTLHRRLKNEGVTYQRLVDDVRRTMAQQYMQDERVSLTEAAFLLGFSEASAFCRAFRRWTGTTPTLYRVRLGKSLKST